MGVRVPHCAPTEKPGSLAIGILCCHKEVGHFLVLEAWNKIAYLITAGLGLGNVPERATTLGN